MCVCWKTNLGPPKQEYTLNIEPSVHPQIVYSQKTKEQEKSEVMYLKLLCFLINNQILNVFIVYKVQYKYIIILMINYKISQEVKPKIRYT